MSINIDGNTAQFSGDCGIESVEALHQFLLEQDAPRLDLAACTHLHGAVLQLLMAAAVTIDPPPRQPAVHQLLRHSGLSVVDDNTPTAD